MAAQTRLRRAWRLRGALFRRSRVLKGKEARGAFPRFSLPGWRWKEAQGWAGFSQVTVVAWGLESEMTSSPWPPSSSSGDAEGVPARVVRSGR